MLLNRSAVGRPMIAFLASRIGNAADRAELNIQ